MVTAEISSEWNHFVNKMKLRKSWSKTFSLRSGIQDISVLLQTAVSYFKPLFLDTGFPCLLKFAIFHWRYPGNLMPERIKSEMSNKINWSEGQFSSTQGFRCCAKNYLAVYLRFSIASAPMKKSSIFKKIHSQNTLVFLEWSFWDNFLSFWIV